MSSSCCETGSNGVARASNLTGTGNGGARIPWCGVPVKVSLVLPPCVPSGQQVSMEVHLDWAPRTPPAMEFELVGAAQGTQMFSKWVSRGDGGIVRVDWTPKGMGVVDVFFLASKSGSQVSVGELGHLLVLPTAVCKEGNSIFAKQVAAGSAKQGDSLVASIQMERGILKLLKTWRSRREDSPSAKLNSISDLVSILDYLRGTSGSARPAVLPADGVVEKAEGRCDGRGRIATGQAIERLALAGGNEWTLRIQKYVWRSDFMSLCLDMDVFFQLLETRKIRASSYDERPHEGCEGQPADLDVAIKLILGNILLHLRKFEAWEFIAHVLQRCAEYEVDVCWGDKGLEKEDLSGSRLQELANNASGARGMLDC